MAGKTWNDMMAEEKLKNVREWMVYYKTDRDAANDEIDDLEAIIVGLRARLKEALVVCEMVTQMYGAESYINGTQFEREVCDRAASALANTDGQLTEPGKVPDLNPGER